MNGLPYGEIKISKMSLAVAKDSGWYIVDLRKGENYTWGKDIGCDIFGTTCAQSSAHGFCSVVLEQGCSLDHTFRTKCKDTGLNRDCPIDYFQQSCKLYRDFWNKENTFGKDSVCLNRIVINIIILIIRTQLLL